MGDAAESDPSRKTLGASVIWGEYVSMLVADSLEALHLHLGQRALDLERSQPLALILAVVEWYEIERATDAESLDDDGDMLLFQWGTYNWADGATFQYDITRQFITGPDDVNEQRIWQLSLTAHYVATDDTALLGRNHLWVGTPSRCDYLRNHISVSPATALVQARDHLRIELGLGQV